MSDELSEDELKLQQPEFASMLEIIESCNEWSKTFLEIVGDFPDRFENPRLKAEAQIVAREVMLDFGERMRELAEAREARRRQ